jgi:hypothetical protein
MTKSAVLKILFFTITLTIAVPTLFAAEIKFADGSSRAFKTVEAQGDFLVCTDAVGTKKPFRFSQLHDSEIQKYFPEKWKAIADQRKGDEERKRAEDEARKKLEEDAKRQAEEAKKKTDDQARFNEQERLKNFAPPAPNPSPQVAQPAQPAQPASNQPPPLPPFIQHQSFIQLDSQYAAIKPALEHLFKTSPPARTRLRQAVIRGGGIEVFIEMPTTVKDEESQFFSDAVFHALINLFRENGFDLKRDRIPLSVWALSVVYPEAPNQNIQARPCGRTMMDAQGRTEFRTINEIVGLVPPR